MLAIMFGLRVSAQEPLVILSGNVKAQNGEALPGVTIKVKGSNQGTSTLTDGTFKLRLNQQKGTLVFSFIGFSSQEVLFDGAFNNTIHLNVILREGAGELDEVVVIGYGTVKKSDLTGTVQSLKPEDLGNNPFSNAAQMLQGRVTGLYVNSADQDPGTTPNMQLRGIGSFSSNTQPLLIIDGFPMPDLASINRINPADIQQIDVLKDASATAIYGAQGGNGVIIVTTKSGSAGKLKIDYGTKLSTQTVAKQMEMMNADEYIRFYYDLAHDPSFAHTFSPAYNGAFYPAPLTSLGTTANTNWQKELQNSNLNQEHNLAISGGKDNWTYRVSGNLFDGNAIIGPAGYNRKNFASRIGYKGKKLSLNLDLNYSLEERNNVKNNYAEALRYTPLTSPFDQGGDLTLHPIAEYSNWLANPLSSERYLDNTSENNAVRLFGTARYELLKGLAVEGRLGWNRNFFEQFRENQAFLTNLEEVRIDNANSSNLSADILLNYNTKLGDHTISAMAGTNYQTFINRDSWIRANGFPEPGISYYNIGAATGEIREFGSSWDERTTQSAFGRFNYDFKNTYLLTVNFRVDGATQYGSENKLGYFPSVAAAWKISNEKFFGKNEYINNLKLKLGYGLSGNSNVPTGRTQAILEFWPTYLGDQTVNAIQWQGGFIPNPDLQWETTRMLNAGIEFGNKRFFAELNYYSKNSEDLILDRQVPTELGYTTITLNKGEMRNHGIEGKIDFYLDLFGGAVRWKPSIWASYNRNEITNLDGDKINSYNVWLEEWNAGNTGLRQEGYPLNTLWGYNFTGIWGQEEKEQAQSYGALPGDPKYRDLNDDGKIDNDDKQYLGNADPKYLAGFSSTFNFKNFQLYFMLDGVFDKKVINSNRLFYTNPYFRGYANLSTEALDRWTPDHQDTDIPALTRAPQKELITSSWSVQDASFARLRELSVSYKLPAKTSRFVRDVSLFASANNVFTITRYKGVNPDIAGIDNQWNVLPFSRTWTLGVNFSL